MIILTEDERFDLLNFQPVKSYIPVEIQYIQMDNHGSLITLVVFRDENDIKKLYGFICRITGEETIFSEDEDIWELVGDEVIQIVYRKADGSEWAYK